MTIIRDLEKLLIVSFNKEAAYGTQVLDANINKLFKLDKIELVRKPHIQNDSNTFNGVDGPMAQAIERWDATLNISGDLTPGMAGWLGSLAMGAVATTIPIAGVYLHTETEIATYDNPSTSMVVQEASGRKKLLKGCVLTKLEIKGVEGNKRLTFNATFSCDGSYADSTVTTPALIAESFLRMGDVTISIGGTNWSLKAKSFDWSLDNGIEGDSSWKPSGGLYRLSCTRQKQRVRTLKVELYPAAAADLATIQGWLDNQTSLAVSISAVGALIQAGHNYTVTLGFPSVQKKSDWKVSPNKGGADIVPVEFEVLYDGTTSKFHDLTVKNIATGYLQ